jgi:hypothetical protein
MTISLKRDALTAAEGPVSDPLPALIPELIRYPLCLIDEEVRAVFAKAGKARCAFCREAPVEEVDHIIPVARGGPDRLENYAGVCRACNMRKTANILPVGILGILLAEAASAAPGRRALIERRRAVRDRSNPKRRKEKAPSTKRMPHHILVDIPEDDLLDLIGLDARYRGAIPLDRIPDRLRPTIDALFFRPIAAGPYADRLCVDVSGGRLTCPREVASLWIAMLNLRGATPQVMTGPDWPAQRIDARARRNLGGKIYQAHVSFGLEDARRLLPMVRKSDNSGTLTCEGAEAAHLYELATARGGIFGTLHAPGRGGSNLFPNASVSASRAEIDVSRHAARVLEILIGAGSACVIMRETGSVLRDLLIDRVVPVRPGLLYRADQDWSAPNDILSI